MRGGSIPLLAWGALLLVLYAINWIWEGDLVPTLSTIAAILIIVGGGVILWLARRESIHRGPPERELAAEAVPSTSLAAAVAGFSVGTILFGFVWTEFLVAFGAGLLILSLGRLVFEVRAQRASRLHTPREGVPR